MEIRATTVLPAVRRPVTLHTADGLELVGELALPEGRDPKATLVCLHPLPTAEGMMDSHVLRKASFRLPALADIAVLRFNTRGTSSRHGTSQGEFGEGETEKHDVLAAIEFTEFEGLPDPWLLGWSFGTELALKWGADPQIKGAILLSPPLHRADEADMAVWARTGKTVVALVPEHDDYLRPDEARERFKTLSQCEVVGVEGAKHLWVGEPYVRRVLDEIVKRVNPGAYPLPVEWDGPYEKDVQTLG
ncbi:alpha/beta hydrolase [Nocardiopsis deserti]|uniref:alpha/beta hydrolase n=1 Tax=Nocardiopsis deserti TaxID=2605988 RepID=UPI00123C2D81|nr:alpha/beta hydrolase [Nocardiopsis deserti]